MKRQQNLNKVNPIEQKQLDPLILQKFYPAIMNEIEKEFAHQEDSRTKRNTRTYGYSFFKMENNDFNFTPVPEFLQILGQHICESLGHPKVEFTNVILSMYEEGFYLEPHVDTNPSDFPNKNYHFDENVYGLIVEPDSTGHLYFIRHDNDLVPPLDLPILYSLEEHPGTIFCLKDSLRKAPYFHGVTSVSKRRISLTFRTVTIK